MFKTFAAAAFALGVAFSLPTGPAQAAPAPVDPVPFSVDTATDVTPVHSVRRHHRHRLRHGGYYGGRYYRRPRASVGVQLNFGPSYGFRDPYYRSGPVYRARPVYRSAPRIIRNYSARHHAWCDGRYKSYRVSDGTFQPYHGPRRRCNSPYDGI